MTVKDLQTKYLNKKVGTGQCAPWAELGLNLLYGVPNVPHGNAVDYASGANQSYFAKYGLVWHPGVTTSIPDGALIVWGNDAGSFTDKYGHVAFGDGGKILDQNYAGKQYVSLDNMFTPGMLGYYAPKPAVTSAPSGFHPYNGTVKALRTLNVRTVPTTQGNKPLHSDPAGTVCTIIGYVQGEKVTQNGVTSNVWLIAWNHTYVWSLNTNWTGVKEI